MRTYELMFVTDPRVADDELKSITEAVHGLVTEAGGTISRTDVWGRRKLAYPINKITEGKYVLTYFYADVAAQGLPEVEHRMGQSDKILRYLIVRTDQGLKKVHGEVTPELAAGIQDDDEDAEDTAAAPVAAAAETKEAAPAEEAAAAPATASGEEE